MLTISTIPEALIELENQTGRVWTDSELFDVATNCNIELHAATPITTQTSLQEFVVGQGLVEKMRMPAGHAALAVLFPWQVGQLWLSHETVTSHPSDHDKKTGKYKVFIEPVKVTREQVRIKSATLKKILQIWKSAQTDKELRHRYPEWMFPQEGNKTLAKDVIQPKNTAKNTMKTITLAAGTTHVPFNEVVHSIAKVIHPEASDDDERSGYYQALIGIESELKNAAKLGQLPVKNPLTLGAWTNPMGNAFNKVLVTVDDFRAFVADRGIKVAVEATESQATELKAKPQISRAPAPITPLTWSNHIQAIATVTPSPKWDKWRHMRDIEIWEAVALSLNLEPNELPVYLGAYDKLGDDPFRICPPSFLERLLVVNSNCGISFSYKPVHDLKARCLVDLPEFAAWVVKQNMANIPPEIVAMGAMLQHEKSEKARKQTKELNAMRMPGDGGMSVNRQWLSTEASKEAPEPVRGTTNTVATTLPDAERRLTLLKKLGGSVKFANYEWKFTGIKQLVQSELGKPRSSEKTIRADLIEAAEKERDAKKAGFADGLGSRN